MERDSFFADKELDTILREVEGSPKAAKDPVMKVNSHVKHSVIFSLLVLFFIGIITMAWYVNLHPTPVEKESCDHTYKVDIERYMIESDQMIVICTSCGDSMITTPRDADKYIKDLKGLNTMADQIKQMRLKSINNNEHKK